MALVYRIESIRGRGPYTYRKNKAQTRKILGVHCADTGHPIPELDFEDKPSFFSFFSTWKSDLSFQVDNHKHLCFGFCSLEKLKQWFEPDSYNELKRVGFYLTTYEVPDDKYQVSRSGKQLVFDKSKAKRVSRELLQ